MSYSRETILQLLEQVAQGQSTPTAALERLSQMPYEDAGFAKIDHHRALRLGLPEVIYAAGKTPEQVAEIFVRMAAAGATVLATRASAEHAAAVRGRCPAAEYHAEARILGLRAQGSTQNSTSPISTSPISSSPVSLNPVSLGPISSSSDLPHSDSVASGVAGTEVQPPADHPLGPLAVLCAGTSDLPVAEEAAVTAEYLGCAVERIWDVGVAGLPRLLAQLPQLRRARAVIVCAGMEGALPSVVGGLVAAPVIAVPTSVGYGAALGGLTALLGMLNSCSPNVCAVNIDNGFGAAYVAASMLRSASRE